MRAYRTIQGDQWDMIAYRLYPDAGRELCMGKLLEANEEHRETVIFKAGVTLTVPEIDIPVADNLPPWKRKRAA
jgi:phage tail protein X